MEPKLISIIIPTYNAEKSIERCIRSIQDEKVEIIVVLDGPTDQTEAVCEKLAKEDSRIQLIKQENQGSFQARKNGIEKANGNYLMFLDSDDAYLPETMPTVRKLIETYHEPDVIRFRYRKEPEGYEQYRYLEDGKEERYLSKEDFKNTIYPMILDGYQFNSLWCNCVKRELLKNQAMERIPVERYGEDLFVNLEIYTKMQNMVLTEKVLYQYITNPQSATQTRNVSKLFTHLQDSIQIYSSFYTYLTKWDMNTEEYQEKVGKRLKKETDRLIQLIQEEIEKKEDGK